MTDVKIGELELDLGRDVLEGWENPYDLLNVEILNKARDLGHVLPRVDVVNENGIYRIRFGRREDFLEVENYGGHSRAIVALYRQEVLRCSLYESHADDPSKSNSSIIYRPISEFPGVSNFGFKSLQRLKGNLNFLPEEFRKEFMKKYDLVMWDENLVTRNNYENPPPF